MQILEFSLGLILFFFVLFPFLSRDNPWCNGKVVAL